jgi:hypothetical protein
MSAYVVSDKTINVIVASVIENGFDPGYYESPEDLALAMYEMNCTAVDARYKDKPSKKFHPEAFRYVKEIPDSRIVVFKLIACYLYQCSEGHVPEYDLYKALRNIQYKFACRIVESLPQYDGLPWGY